ncbi:MAG: zinc-dependent metalloprotease [Microbacterium sp.]
MADDDRSPEEEFQELMRQLLGSSGGDLDPEQLSALSGLQLDPATIATIMKQLQGAFVSAQGKQGIDWELTKRQALHLANQSGRGITDGQSSELSSAFQLAGLWLSDATTVPELTDAPRAMTRGQWVEATLPVWQELAEPVATSFADAFARTMREQVPEEMQGIVESASRLIRGVGGPLFATQLGHVVGRLSGEVVSGGDVGIPVMPAGVAAILPQNFADFGEGLGLDDDQLALYLATRELAHARLFRHAKWLRLHVIAQVTESARGTLIDTEPLEELAAGFDPSRPEELRGMIERGDLLRRSQEGQAALTRLENLLATIEGWVEVVTTDATARLPSAERIAEAVRRRRAVGGPAEQALGSLVGLTLRPRRMREASAMWRAVTDAVGVEARDALWDYPDFMPTAEDIDDPAALVERLRARARGEEPARDAMDDALEALLSGDLPEAGGDGGSDAGPEDPRPV